MREKDAMLEAYIAWESRAMEPDDDCRYLNGEDREDGGDAWSDLADISEKARAAKEPDNG